MKNETRLATVIVLLALALRLAHLTFQPLWADEGYSVYFASLSPLALAAATAADIHPPFYYYLLKVWMALFGPGEFALRLLSVVAGTATVAFTYALATRLMGRKVALLSALLLAVSPFHVYYSQEVRMYALVGMLAVASTLFMLQTFDAWAGSSLDSARWQRVAPLLYAVTTALALYTLYYAAFVPIAQTLFVLVRYRRQWGVLARWLALQALTFVLYVPWLVGATGALATYVGGKVAVEKFSAMDPLSFVWQVCAALGMGVPSAGRTLLTLGAIPVLALAVAGAAIGLRRTQAGPRNSGNESPSQGLTPGETVMDQRRWSSALLALLVIVPVALGYIVNLVWPFSPTGFQRLFMYCLPFLLILVARGIEWGLTASLPDRMRAAMPLALAVVGAFALATLSDFYVSPRYARHDYRPLVHDMAALAHPDDVVIALYPWQLGFVRSYFVGQLPRLLFIDRTVEWASYPAVMRQDLDRLGQAGRLWFPSFEGAGGLLEGAVTSYLTDAAYPALARWYGDHRLQLFAFGEAGPARKRGIVAGGSAMLESTALSLQPVEAGKDCVGIELRWRGDSAFPPDAQVGLRLADDAGRSWARRDSKPRNGLGLGAAVGSNAVVIDHHALAIPATTPPGVYRMLLSVFDQASNTALALSDGGGASLGNEVEIGTVVVTKSSYHAPVQALDIPTPAAAQFVGGPRLVGYRLPVSLKPGHVVEMDLFWQAQDKTVEDPILFVQIRDRMNKIWGLYEGPAVAAQYPPSRWSAGEVLRGQMSFLLAPDAPGGEYRIVVGLRKGRSKERLALTGGGTELVIGRPTVVARPHVMALPQPGTAVDERLGDDVQFLGFDGEVQSARPGAPLPMTLYWRALSRMDVAYVVFVHLVDEKGRIWAQRDSEPVGGDVPTTSWLPGEVISDAFQLDVPANLPDGQYRLLLGMYNRATQRRLAAQSSGSGQTADTVVLGRVQIGQ